VPGKEEQDALATGPAPLGDVLHCPEAEETRQEGVERDVPAHGRSLAGKHGR